LVKREHDPVIRLFPFFLLPHLDQIVFIVFEYLVLLFDYFFGLARSHFSSSVDKKGHVSEIQRGNQVDHLDRLQVQLWNMAVIF